jgi:molybdate transport system substrate-binding protein
MLCFMFFGCLAQPVRVAVAANASFVLKKLAAEYKKKTGITIEVISGSSGKLATQIKNGAPYDIFLSADMEFTDAVYKAGFALTRPKVYAMGSLIIGSATGASLKSWKQLVSSNTGGKIAIANPQLAPYGKCRQAQIGIC